MAEVVGIRFKENGKMYYFDPDNKSFSKNEKVIVETVRGIECGEVISSNHKISDEEIVHPLKKVLRAANPEDIKILENNRKKEAEAFAFCEKKVEQLGLDMKLVEVECTFDGGKMLFYFTSDDRVDFRELVKILASQYRTRIEMRQIGVRDVSKMIGGLGICGRLLCCLKYEQDSYEYLAKITPRVGSIVDTREGRGTVTESNLLTGKLKVTLDRRPEAIPTEFSRKEVKLVKRAKINPETDAETFTEE